MGVFNRTYWKGQQPQGGGSGSGMGMGMGLPRPTPAVKWLLIINFAAFLAQIFVEQGRRSGLMSGLLGVTVAGYWQVWRYVTFQFLHSGVLHIGLNMLGLYMLGTAIEGRLGTRGFLRFYLSCGVAAGLAYVLIGLIFGLDHYTPIIGASGGVFGIVLASAVWFPQFRLILIVFLVPIRLAAVIIFGGMILLVLSAISHGQTHQAMSDVAHLGGAGMAALWIWVSPTLRGLISLPRLRQGAWERKLKQRAQRQTEIDRILQKIHDRGIDSLSAREKNFLSRATKQQQEEDRRINRI